MTPTDLHKFDESIVKICLMKSQLTTEYSNALPLKNDLVN